MTENWSSDRQAPPRNQVGPGGDMPLNAPTDRLSFHSKSSAKRFIIGLVLVAGGLLIAAIPFLAEVKAGRNAGKAVILGLIGASAGVVFLFSGLRNRRIHVETSAEGLSLEVNDVVERCAWSDIAQIREVRNKAEGELLNQLYHAAQGTNHIVEVTCQDGRVLQLNNLIAELPRLAAVIQDATLPQLYTPAFNDVCQGEAVSFGPFTVTEHQINADSKGTLAWPQVQEVRIENGSVQVFQVGQKRAWCITPIGEVPNAHVLLRLARMLQAAASADPEMAARAMEAAASGNTTASSSKTVLLVILGVLSLLTATVLGYVGNVLRENKLDGDIVLLTMAGGFLLLGVTLIVVGIAVRRKPGSSGAGSR